MIFSGLDYLGHSQHNWVMELEEYKKCPTCGAVMKTDACLRCGYLDTDNIKEHSLVESKKEIKSLFEQYVTQEFDMLQADPQKPATKRFNFKKILLTLLSLTFVTLISIASYFFVFANVKYLLPAQLESDANGVNVQNILDQIKTNDSELQEKTLDISLDLKEGNFDKSNFAVFAGNETNLYLELFDFRHFVKNILNKNDIVEQIKKDFDMNDDDLTTFFASEFAMIFPDADFEKWGIVLKYRSDESNKFIEERMAMYKKYKENPKGNYVNYFIEVKKVDEENFLLISNSKIYVDQMKEYSEGNLTDLSQDGLFTQSIKDLTKLGNVLIYKKADTPTWKYVSEFVVKKFPEYVGLDQMLTTLDSRGLGVYQKDGKTKIVYTKTQ